MKIVQMIQTVGDRAVGGQYKVADEVADDLIQDGRAKLVSVVEEKAPAEKGEPSAPKKKKK